MITTVFQKFLRTICLTHEKRFSNDWSQLIVWPEMDQKSSMVFSSHPELLACDVTCLTTTRHMTDSWQNERKLRYMPMIDLVQFSNSISRRSWHFLCNVCYDPNKVLLNVRHGFILGGCSSSARAGQRRTHGLYRYTRACITNHLPRHRLDLHLGWTNDHLDPKRP